MKEEADGDCFTVAAQLVLQNSLPWIIHAEILGTIGLKDFRLCHGTVTRQQDQLQHVHAWVEAIKDNQIWCIDFANDQKAIIPADIYYHVGSIKTPVQYTREEMLKLMHIHQHYGPWEDEECLTSTLM